MKRIYLYLSLMLSLGFLQSQGQYQITVCGGMTDPINQPVNLSIEQSVYGTITVNQVTTDNSGNFCTDFTIYPDSGNYAFCSISVTQPDCPNDNPVILANLVLTSDTNLWVDVPICADSSLGCFAVITEDPNNTGTLSVTAYGTAPFTYTWDDGVSGQQHSFAPGDTFCVIVSDMGGCVSEACFPDFATTPACGVIGYAMEDSTTNCCSYVFYADGNGNGNLSYTWEFSDGGSATGQSPFYTFPSASGPNGPWEACVTVTDADGCESSDCFYVDGTPPYPACDAFFSYTSDNSGLVTLEAFGTGVAPFTYSWTFSDGTLIQGNVVTHQFPLSNSWSWACIDITDADSCMASWCEYIYFGIDDSAACVADFYSYFDDINGNAGEIFLYDMSYNFTNGNPVSWNWNFGDGSASTLQNPSHTYIQAGIYNICLEVVFSDGCSSQMCQTHYIDTAWWGNTNPWNPNGNNCYAGFEAVQDSSNPSIVYLVDYSFGNNLHYTWDFGNGIIINDPYPFVNFSSPDAFTICLTVTDTISGCISTYCDSVGVDANGNLIRTSGWSISVIPAPTSESVQQALNINETTQNKLESVTLYPNPTTEQIYLHVENGSSSDQVHISIHDVSGKTIQTQSLAPVNGNTYRISLKGLQPGYYFLGIADQNSSITKTFIIK